MYANVLFYVQKSFATVYPYHIPPSVEKVPRVKKPQPEDGNEKVNLADAK